MIFHVALLEVSLGKYVKTDDEICLKTSLLAKTLCNRTLRAWIGETVGVLFILKKRQVKLLGAASYSHLLAYLDVDVETSI